MSGKYTPEQIKALRDLIQDDETYCATCLKVLNKKGDLVPFIWNKAQRYIHERLEAQRAEKGYVRALILKGRQQGCSTYVAARYYKRTSTTKGRRAFIVSHEEKSTQNLFAMVKRYDDHNPLAPSKKASNAQELIFGRMDAGYKLATAGSQDVGRGNTAQLLHGSEFGFWQNAQKHLAGIGNSIPLSDGTEIILESTANGLGNAFHLMWQEAEASRGEYIAIFVPWMWQEEYRLPVPADFELDEAEEKYASAHGCDLGQMVWRRAKIAEYGKGFEWLFDQEYPATAAMAFQTATQNPLISPSDVMQAVNNQFRERTGPLLIGCDPAEEGMDRTAIVFRQGRTVFRVEYHEKKRAMEVTGILAGYWQQFKPDGLFVDKGGIGAGIVDRLRELGIPVIAVNFGERATDSELYENKRAECWWRMKEWIEDHPNRLPNDAALIADLIAPQPAVTSKSKRLLESKKDMRKRGIRSPDGGDALALTFSEFVAPAAATLGGISAPKPATHVGY